MTHQSAWAWPEAEALRDSCSLDGAFATTPVAGNPHERQSSDSLEAGDGITVYDRWLGTWRVSLRRRPLSCAELLRSYDRAAPGWSRKLKRLGVASAYAGLFKELLAEEPLEAQGASLRVLDCGVGTGALSLALAKAMARPFTLDALDISPRMLAIASGRFCDAGVAAKLNLGDIRALPYAHDSFDLVMVGHLLEHFADPKVALCEALRVLKPGGLLVTCLTRRSLQGLLVQLVWRTHRVTAPEAETWLQNAGLDQVRSLSFQEQGFCLRASLAAVGRKPLG